MLEHNMLGDAARAAQVTDLNTHTRSRGQTRNSLSLRTSSPSHGTNSPTRRFPCVPLAGRPAGERGIGPVRGGPSAPARSLLSRVARTDAGTELIEVLATRGRFARFQSQQRREENDLCTLLLPFFTCTT
jgi:hypothetical protein